MVLQSGFRFRLLPERGHRLIAATGVHAASQNMETIIRFGNILTTSAPVKATNQKWYPPSAVKRYLRDGIPGMSRRWSVCVFAKPSNAFLQEAHLICGDPGIGRCRQRQHDSFSAARFDDCGKVCSTSILLNYLALAINSV